MDSQGDREPIRGEESGRGTAVVGLCKIASRKLDTRVSAVGSHHPVTFLTALTL